MRRIGTLPDPALARRFADFLVTLKIDCIVDQESTGEGAEQAVSCHLWIRDETHVDSARKEFEAFRESPDDPRYQVQDDAERIRKERLAEERRKQKLRKTVRHRSPSPMMGLPIKQQSIPVVITILVICILLGVVTLLDRPSQTIDPNNLPVGQKVDYALRFADPIEYFNTGDPWVSIRKGEIWRIITPVFMHGDLMHLAFNMLMLWFLGSAIERLQGSWFMGSLFAFGGIAGGVVQVLLPPASELPPVLAGLAGTPMAIGASGAVYALFGYLWIRPMVSPSFPIRMPQINVVIILGWLFFAMFFVDRVANGAHFGGLAAGILVAAIVSRLPGGS
ncbi:MAG: rhomboid family intramembrane serine protease [Planctomycetota bacterium]